MLQEIKQKWNEISKRQPTYLGDYEYSMIKVEYHTILTTILKLLSNIILTDNQINVIEEKIDTNFVRIIRQVGDRIAFKIMVDFNKFIDELIADCIETECYESAENLKRIKPILHL